MLGRFVLGFIKGCLPLLLGDAGQADQPLGLMQLEMDLVWINAPAFSSLPLLLRCSRPSALTLSAPLPLPPSLLDSGVGNLEA